MTETTTTPIWRMRYDKLRSEVVDVTFPDGETLAQDREWCEVALRNGDRRRVRFHDYDQVYSIPGLYEQLFYVQLKCNSPHRVARLLGSVMRELKEDPRRLRVLDVGAGNGMVGEELERLGARHLVGVDIYDEARVASERDRPGLYQDYFVGDLTDLPEEDEERLRKHELNALACVAALGFGDIPPAAFTKALDLIDTPGWLALNIKEDFITFRDASGFAQLIRELSQREVIQIQAYRRYQHRVSTTGEPLYYVAMVAKKLKDLPDDIMSTQA